MAIFPRLAVETAPLVTFGGEAVSGPWPEGPEATLWEVGEEAELGGVATIEGGETGEETVGEVAGAETGEETVGEVVGGGEAGDGAAGDWTGDALGAAAIGDGAGVHVGEDELINLNTRRK